MDQGTRTRPATAADFHRLADLAHERGLHLFRDGRRWFCSSASDPGGSHYVTGFSCDCAGFISHQRCTHHALLLARLGWLPEVEEETPATIACPSCTHGKIEAWGVSGLIGSQPCDQCGGSGVRPDHRLRDAPAIEVVAVAA